MVDPVTTALRRKTSAKAVQSVAIKSVTTLRCAMMGSASVCMARIGGEGAYAAWNHAKGIRSAEEVRYCTKLYEINANCTTLSKNAKF